MTSQNRRPRRLWPLAGYKGVLWARFATTMFEEEWLVKTTLRDAFHITVPALLLMALSACGGGGGGGGTSPPSVNQPVSSGSSPNPVPTISALSPSCAPAGEQFIDGVDNQLTVIGPNDFVTGSVVRWNGSDRPTTNGSGNWVTAQISASDIATAGTAVVTVFNPAAGGTEHRVPAMYGPAYVTRGAVVLPASAAPTDPLISADTNVSLGGRLGTESRIAQSVELDSGDIPTFFVSAM